MPFAIGFSQSEDPREAAHQAAVAVKNKLNSISTELVLVFASNHYARKEVLDTIHTILKPARLIGSSSTGIILSHGTFSRGLSILGINSENIHFSIGNHSVPSDSNAYKAGIEFARKVNVDYKSPFKPQMSLVFANSIAKQTSSFINGIHEIWGQPLPMAGAVYSDDFKVQKNYNFYQKQILSHESVGCLISSNALVVSSDRHGFKPLGKPRTITKSHGHLIETIDGKPALDIYKEFLREEAHNLKESFLNSPAALYPLGIYLEESHQYLIRYPVDILDDGSIVCQADVPTHTEVHLMISNKDSCKEAAIAAAQEIKRALGGRQAQMLIILESMVRHRILSHHSFLEVQAIKEILGYSTPIIGMYCLGELCSLGLDINHPYTHLQNGSISLLAIG